jgi:chromate transporter
MPSTPHTSAARFAPRSKFDLFWSFTILALQGFGGVLAVVQRELVEKKQWLTPEEFAEDWAVAQILPGPNVVNLSLMIGSRSFGLGGALSAFAGILLIPLILILILAAFIANVADSEVAQGILRGMSAVSAGLIAATGVKLMRTIHTNPMGKQAYLAMMLVTLFSVVVMHWPLILVLLIVGSSSCVWAWRCLIKEQRA